MVNTAFTYPKGKLDADGLLFIGMPEATLQERILQTWIPTSRLIQVADGYLLLWPTAKLININQSLAIPIMREHTIFTNILLSKTQQQHYQQSFEQLALVYKGELTLFDLRLQPQIDPAIWLDIPYTLQTVESLGCPPKKPVQSPQSTLDNVRNMTKDNSLVASDQLTQTLSALKTRSQQQGDKGPSIMSALKGAFSNTKNQHGSSQQSLFMSRIKSSLSNYLMASKLGKTIGRSQAKYLQSMMEKFSQGNLTDALKHAIPLKNLEEALNASHASMKKLRARNDLSLSLSQQADRSGSLYLSEPILQRLNQLYENAFKQLDNNGDVKKAAFVLAELLKDIDRAVNYLEKKDKLTLAAELAEGQKLPADRIIRQWIIAGNIERAMTIAKLSSYYEQAITSLEKNHPKQASHLRWHCAQLHFSTGNYTSAIDIAWPLAEKRKEIIEWLKQSVSEGGSVSTKHRLRLAMEDHPQRELHLTLLSQQLQQQNDLDIISKADLIDEIIAGPKNPTSAIVATLLARTYLKDAARGIVKLDNKRWQALLNKTNDLALRIDIAQVTINTEQLVTLASRIEPLQITINNTNGRAPRDVAQLCNGEFLVAFGESGVEHWSHSGGKLQSYNIPCHHIVMSDHGNQALLLAERSGYQIVHKFYLHNRNVKHWLELSLSHWATSYDGINWLTGKHNHVWLLDTQAKQQSALWSIDTEANLIDIKRSQDYLCFVTQLNSSVTIWRYKASNLYLKERNAYDVIDDKNIPVAYSATGTTATLNLTQDRVNIGQSSSWHELPSDGKHLAFSLWDNWLGLTSQHEQYARYNLYHSTNDRLSLSVSITLPACQAVQIRQNKQQLTLWSDNGTICTIDLDHGRISNEIHV